MLAPGALADSGRSKMIEFRRSTNSSTARLLVAAVIACGLMTGAARAADSADDLAKLFDLGLKSTPTAIAEAKAQYDELSRDQASDRRLDYAYGLVLVNQHQYRDAATHLARYMEHGKPELGAYRAMIWAQIPRQEYADVLDQATALAKRFSGSPTSKPDERYRDAARFLGTVFAYLESARPTAVDGELRKERQQQVMDQLGKTYKPAFAEAFASVGKRAAELQAEHKEHLEQLKSKLESKKGEDKTAADEARDKAATEKEDAKFSKEQLETAQKEYDKLQTQLSPLIMQEQNLQSQIMVAQQQIVNMRRQRGNNGMQSQNLRASVSNLQKQLQTLNRQTAPLQKKATQLEAEGAQNKEAHSLKEAQARKDQKTAAAADKKLRAAEARLKSAGAIDGKLILLSSYASFPYEQERDRVLAWFSK